jgi:hypothetical protein
MVYDSGREFKGEWWADVRHGSGLELYENGSVYKGSFQGGNVIVNARQSTWSRHLYLERFVGNV